jgi:CBS domain-containing protein
MPPLDQNSEPLKRASSEARLLRIFIDESSHYRGRPLYDALLEMLKKEGCAGATATRAIRGFGGHGVIHSEHVVDVVPELPIIVEVVDNLMQLEKIRPRLVEMVGEGLIIVQEVEVWKYSYHPRLREVPASATVGQVMTRAVVSVKADTPLVEVVRLLLDQHQFKALPVVDWQRRVIGIITDGDLLIRGNVPHSLSLLEKLDQESLKQLLDELHHNSKTAAEVMTAPVVTLRPETSVHEAAHLLIERQLKRLPVVDSEGQLVGMLGRVDVLKLVANSIPAQALTDSPAPLAGSESAPKTYRVARDVMRSGAPTIAPETPVAELLERLVTSQLRRMVVVDKQRKILGVITDADLVVRVSPVARPGILATLARGLGLKKSDDGRAEVVQRSSARTARELMTTKVIAVGPDEPIEEVIRLMVQRQIKFLPVQTVEGQLLGVVLRSDLLRAVADKIS